MERVEFIKKYYPLISTLGKPINIFPETALSQAFIEGTAKGTDGKYIFGESYAMKHGNNIYNIKPGSGWHGDTVINPYVKGESNVFRAYPSLEDSIKDYFKFLVSNRRYKTAGVFDADNYQEQADAMQRSGYAGKDTGYATLMKNLGKTISTALGKAKDIVKTGGKIIATHKSATGIMIAAAVAVALGLALNKKHGRG